MFSDDADLSAAETEDWEDVPMHFIAEVNDRLEALEHAFFAVARPRPLFVFSL